MVRGAHPELAALVVPLEEPLRDSACVGRAVGQPTVLAVHLVDTLTTSAGVHPLIHERAVGVIALERALS